MRHESWITRIYGYEAFRDDSAKFISAHYDRRAGTLKEEYMIYSKKDTNIHVKAFYSYTAKKFQNIDYSLSKQLDSIKKMKLYEIKIFQPSKYYENYKLTMDGFEQRYTLEALEVPDQKKFLSIFNRYLRDIGKSR